jgi:hypothetical protein
MIDLSKIENEWVHSNSYFSFQEKEKFINYFFDGLDIEKINGSIFGIQHTEFENEDMKKINVLVCVENCNFWNHYAHYNKYGPYGNKNIKIYIYNHIARMTLSADYIGIPTIYPQMRYFKRMFEHIKPTLSPAEQRKKFCLIATRITDNRKKMIVDKLQSMGLCDFLNDYKEILANKSCYHSQELLDVFSRYKYVFVAENSIQEGYVTEKIFNCFFARTIPIYNGAPDITRYFNKDSFIHIRNLQDLQSLVTNDGQTPSLDVHSIINQCFDDENYIEKVNCFIEKILT